MHAEPQVADVLVCVPSTLLSRAVQQAAGRIATGGEDCRAEVSGAFTGDVSADMLKDAGATTVILGHSERREYHGETDAMVSAKARAASRTGLSANICIGETQSQHRDGATLAIYGEQIAGSLPADVARSGPSWQQTSPRYSERFLAGPWPQLWADAVAASDAVVPMVSNSAAAPHR